VPPLGLQRTGESLSQPARGTAPTHHSLAELLLGAAQDGPGQGYQDRAVTVRHRS
jgi:hypothetical protein